MARRTARPSTDVARRDQLTTDQEVAAQYASQGIEGPALAKELGVAIATVRAWERNPAWIARRNEMVMSKHFANGALVQDHIAKLVTARNRAVEVLVGLLEAEDDEGRPQRDTRLRAAELLTKMPLKDTMSEVAIAQARGAAATEINDAKPAGNVSITFVTDASGHVEPLDGYRVIEGEVVEDADVIDPPAGGAPPV